MSRGFAIFTLVLQVLGHATNMALRHDSSLMWFFIHLVAGIGSIVVLAKRETTHSSGCSVR